MTGTIKWYHPDKGYGFIAPDDEGPDIYVHHTGLRNKAHGLPQAGDQVSYKVGQGERGPKAVEVVIFARSAAC